MGSRGRGSNGRSAETPSSDGRAIRRRACLVLSLIVLVGNLAASGRRFLFSAAPALHAAATAELPPSPHHGNDGGGRGPVGARTGRLTLRQRFLLGERVDINRAGIAEISELPGLSEDVARAVVEERRRVGRFKAPEDLLAVRGIKEKRLEKILPFLFRFPNN